MYKQNLQQKIFRTTSSFLVFVLVFGATFNFLPQPVINQAGQLSYEPALSEAHAAVMVSEVFDTNGTATFTVPSGVTSVDVKVWGAGGGAGGGYTASGIQSYGGDGGAGGFASGTVDVSNLSSLQIRVGDSGKGGNTNSEGGGGGDYSGIFTATNLPLLIAGGGGGGGGAGANASYTGGAGGAGGGENGLDGGEGVGTNKGASGKGGTQSTGGAHGGSYDGTDGAAGSSYNGGGGGNGHNTNGTGSAVGGKGGIYFGGANGGSSYFGGGGGGSGYYGGGGAEAAGTGRPWPSGGGAGGGSGFASTTLVSSYTLAAGTGSTPPNINDTDYVSGRGEGGLGRAANSGLAGSDGLVVIYYTVTSTTITTGSDPASTTIAPGSSAIITDAFTLQSETTSDTITSVIVGHSNASAMSQIEIVSDNEATVYGSISNPTGTSSVITLSTNTLTVGTSQTAYKIRVTPKAHTDLPSGIKGSMIPISTHIVSWTGDNSPSGSDTSYPFIIDNQSLPSFGISGTQSFATKVDYSTGSNGSYALTSSDFNNDGYADLAVINFNASSVSVFLNNGDGTFATKVDYTTGAKPYSITSSDFNNDGYADLVVAHRDSNFISVLLNNGNGTFATKVDYTIGSNGSYSVTAGDFNNDGYIDLVAANYGSASVSVFLNNGNGTFATKVDYTTGSAPRSVTNADFNNDGYIDLAVANESSNSVSVLINNGNGTFSTKVDYAVGASPLFVITADFNNDGYADLAASSNGNYISVFLNNGNGTFATKVDYTTGTSPYSITAADFNNDGYTDIVAANWSTQTSSVFLNNGNGTFATKVDYTTGTLPATVASSDFNNDGFIDFVVTESNSGVVSVFLNNSTSSLTATLGSNQATISYVTPPQSDLNSILVLRSTSVITDAPVDGITYTAGNSIGSATVGCVDTTIATSTSDSCTVTSLDSGTSYYLKVFVKDDYGNYSAGIDPSGSPVTLPRASPEVWSPSAWTTYEKITIDSAQVDATLTDFPVYVDLSDLSDSFWNTTDANYPGVDIRVTTDDGSPIELPREIVSASSTAKTGELHFKANSISSTTDTIFRIYYNGTTTEDYAKDATYGAQNVWIDNYVAVYHDGGETDSTAFNRTAIPQGSVTEGNTSGPVGMASDLNGTDQAFISSDVTGVNGLSGYTASMWIRSDAGSVVDDPIYSIQSATYDDSGDNYTGLRFDAAGFDGGGTNVFKAKINTDGYGPKGETLSNTAELGTWMHMHKTWDNSTNPVFDLYKNGSLMVWETGAAPTAAYNTIIADVVAVGRGNKNGWWDGAIDEFRIASTSLSAAWVKAEYTNQGNTRSFYTVNDEYVDGYNTATSTQTWVVPDGVYEIGVKVWGAGGGGGGGGDAGGSVGGDGGAGGYIEGTIAVTPGETLSLYVGGGGGGGEHIVNSAGSSGGGGGYTGIFRGSSPLFIAGAGGGGGGASEDVINENGGDGGVGGGLTGGTATGYGNGNGGAGGTQSSGGSGGSGSDSSGDAGTYLSGGAGKQSSNTGASSAGTGGLNGGGVGAIGSSANRAASAGGGAGYYGGGGGGSSANGSGGGGGGSSFATSSATATSTAAGSGTTPPNTGSSFYVDGVGMGGAGLAPSNSSEVAEDGGDGFLVITYSLPREFDNSNWTTYDTITIRHENIDEALTDFPVYIDLSDLSSQFWSAISDGGGDIRVTTDEENPTELAREVVSASSSLQTGELHFKAPRVSEVVDTSFRVYYNGIDFDYTADQTYGANNVWTNDYVGVWHMDQVLTDSTGLNTATNIGTIATTTNAQIGYARSFNGTSDYIQTSLEHLNVADNSTISLWVNSNNEQEMFVWEGEVTGNGWGPQAEAHLGRDTSSGEPELSVEETSKEITSIQYSYLNGKNYYVVGTFADLNTATADYELFVDGVSVGSESSVSQPHSSYDTNMRFGRPGTDSRYLNGKMDEVRIASITRSAAWIKAEYVNQATTTDFYTLTGSTDATGSSTISNHDAGQVANAFSYQNKTSETLFAFKLTPNTGNATVTRAEIVVSGFDTKRLNVSDFTNIRLFRDNNNDGAYDGSDTQVGGSGSFSLWHKNNQYGTIVFTTDFLIITAQNFIVIADWDAPPRGASMKLDLNPEGLDMYDSASAVVVDGSVSYVQHIRNSGGGSYFGGGGSVGGNAPAGDGDVGGGSSGGGTGGGSVDTNTGGDTIGNEPDFNWPSAHSGAWTNAANAYDQVDGTYATAASAISNEFKNYTHGVPVSDTIVGIEVKLEVSGTTAAGNIAVALSWNQGSSWTETKSTPTLTTTDAVVTLGGPSETWGRTWTAEEFSNANFSLKVTASQSSNTLRIDALQVKIYHQASGGGGGGGGGI